METNSKTMLAAGGILAVALTIGSQIDTTSKPVPEPVSVQIGKAIKGAEIKALRTANKEVYKADSVWVHPKDSRGKEVKADSFKVAAFTARVYAGPKYFMDADGDTLRPLDLTVREISALAKLNPLKTHDKYVDAGPYTAQWMDARPGEFRMDAGAAFVKYRAIFAAKGTTVAVQATATGMKETVVLADSTAGVGDPAGRPYGHVLRWIVETDGSLAANAAGGFDVRAKDGSVPMRIQKPVAWDAGEKPVMASATVEGDTLTFRVTVLPGQKYPVTVDPTTSIKTFIGGYVGYNNSGSYATARDAVTGSLVETDRIYVGQEYAGSVYGVRRGFLGFPGIPSMAAASAETLYIRGYNDYSTADFDINIFGARSFRSTLTTADYSMFNGWRSGDTFNGTVLNEIWNSASYTTWNPILFAAAGRDSLVAATGDTLWIAILSYEDARRASPGGAQWIYFYGEGSGANEPYISFTYTAPYANPPTGYTLHTPTTTGMKASWTNRHTPGVDSLTRYNGAGVWQKKLDKADTSETITALSINTQYAFKDRVDSAGSFAYSNTANLYTLANPPVSWNFTEDYDDSTKVNIGFGTNGNPAGTQYAIRDSTNQKWVGSDGIADSTHRVWLTSAQWTSLGKLINRVAAQRQRFGVVARNGDGIETSYVWGALTIGNVRLAIAPLYGAVPDTSHTHRARSSNYTTAHDQTAAGSIFTTPADTLGQVYRTPYYTIWRPSLQYTLPSMDTALACTVFVTANVDSSHNNFGVSARLGSWSNLQDISRRFWDFLIGAVPNYIESWSTASYANPIKWIHNAAGIALINSLKSSTGVYRMNFISQEDSAASAPDTTKAEYIVISNPVIHLRYYKTDAAPTNVVVTAASTTSLLVTWTDNTINETGFYLVNAYTGARIGGDDSTSANAQTKTLTGLSVNALYNIAVKVKGGKLDGEVSSVSDSAYTKAATPGAPTRSNPADDSTKIIIDANGNPAYTDFAVGAVTTANETLWVNFTTTPPTFRTFGTVKADSAWAWRNRAEMGGDNGFTMATAVGKYYKWIVKALSGQ